MQEISTQVGRSRNTDITDVIFNMSADGVYSAYSAAYFFHFMRERLNQGGTGNETGYPLSFFTDGCLGSGTGSLVASAVATDADLVTLMEGLSHAKSRPLPDKRILGCLGSTADFATGAASAYFGKEPIHKPESHSSGPEYDSLTIGKNSFIIKLFGHLSTGDLKTRLELISNSTSESILELVTNAIGDRDADAAANYLKWGISEFFESAHELFAITAEPSRGYLKKISKEAARIKFTSIDCPTVEGGGSSISALLKHPVLKQHLFMINFSSEVTQCKSPITLCNCSVTPTANGFQFVTINVKVTIPNNWPLGKKRSKSKQFNLIKSAVETIFPPKNGGRLSNAQCIMESLIGFLIKSNNRAVSDFNMSAKKNFNMDFMLDDQSLSEDFQEVRQMLAASAKVAPNPKASSDAPPQEAEDEPATDASEQSQDDAPQDSELQPDSEASTNAEEGESSQNESLQPSTFSPDTELVSGKVIDELPYNARVIPTVRPLIKNHKRQQSMTPQPMMQYGTAAQFPQFIQLQDGTVAQFQPMMQYGPAAQMPPMMQYGTAAQFQPMMMQYGSQILAGQQTFGAPQQTQFISAPRISTQQQNEAPKSETSSSKENELGTDASEQFQIDLEDDQNQTEEFSHDERKLLPDIDTEDNDPEVVF
jgi:hypothetical protein